MSTKDEIVKIGDRLIRSKGYNAFSFYDISKELGIKNASVHYHFATKTELVLSVIRQQIWQLEQLIENTGSKPPLIKLHSFFSIYSNTKSEDNICVVGSLATDIKTVNIAVQKELKILVNKILSWVSGILKEGKRKKVFIFNVPPRTKALMIITNMLASVQLTRLTDGHDFELIKRTILKELKA